MNRATTKGFKRIRQSAWCCGRNYQRWRLVGGRFPNGKMRCPHCGSILEFRIIKNPTLECYHRRAWRFRLAGKTVLGQPRRRSLKSLTQQERNLRMLDRYRMRRDGFFARGLTSRGTRRVIRRGPTPIEKQWQELRATVVMPVSADWDLFSSEREL